MNENLLNQVNEKIDNMTKFGYRNVTTQKRGYKLSWSNNGMRWYPMGRVLPAGTYKIDANEIIVQAPSTQIDEILPLLHELPLYNNSTEARKRGEYLMLTKEYYEDYPEDRKKKSTKPKPKRKVIKKCKCK
jgi:hypothetical protein